MVLMSELKTPLFLVVHVHVYPPVSLISETSTCMYSDYSSVNDIQTRCICIVFKYLPLVASTHGCWNLMNATFLGFVFVVLRNFSVYKAVRGRALLQC